MSIIIFIIILAVLILVHEFGHFIVAKRAGIRVDEFGLGFPPRLFAKKWGGTVYTLNAIPFGGFVKIFGEDPEGKSGTTSYGAGAHEDRNRNFQYKPRWIQAVVLIAGVTFNMIFAWLILCIVFLSFVKGTYVTWFILRDTTIGLGGFLWHLIIFKADFSQVSGFIGIAKVVSDASRVGFSYILYISAIISINLAVINLLPFPALDGGRLLFVGVEAIIRRPLKPEFVRWVNTAGFVCLIILMVLVTGHDIFRLL